MKKLFSIQPSNTHQPLLLSDFSGWSSIGTAINRSKMTASDFVTKFDFRKVDQKTKDLPNICTVYISGALAFQAEFKDQLFPNSSIGLEFLPITASGRPWLLLNCLQAASGIDVEGSEVMRSLNGDIFFVMKIRVTDPKAHEWDIFTLRDSNRAQLFVTDAFRERVERLELKGITFQAIGELT